MKGEKGGSRFLATVSDYQQCFGTPAGKRVLRHLMKVHGIMNAQYIPDTHATAYNEGARNVVIQVLNKVRWDLKKLEKEIMEQEKEGESDVVI
jgi:hypothetical protein